ncbi:uroporphyrinogen-III synthase [Gleimia hominis]|uniref:Uroporphyrinogen-III synthase n=1 Tax=Gleimia hominis TaxID=595468 RepID=A0ABU3I8H5_9ACTO|nr:uroporphyrinogen-III synthase [Gleimia hominis]
MFIPRSGADNLSAALRAAGAHVHAHALTRTELDTNPLPYLITGAFDWVVFTSKRTVKAFAAFASADSPTTVQYADQPDYAPLREVWRQARASSLHGFRVAALGQSTANELRKVGIEIDFEVVEKVTAEEFCHQFTSAPPDFTRHPHVWVPASAKARHVIKDELTRKGWVVDQTPVYDTVAVTSVPTEVSTGWTMGMFDAVAFTAASNAQAAANLLGPLPDSSRVVTFGPPSARAAQSAGFRVDAVAQTQTAAGLVAAVEQAFHKH